MKEPGSTLRLVRRSARPLAEATLGAADADWRARGPRGRSDEQGRPVIRGTGRRKLGIPSVKRGVGGCIPWDHLSKHRTPSHARIFYGASEFQAPALRGKQRSLV